MDPLSALAIAAAVFQFLELGGKLCVKGWETYKQVQRDVPNEQKLAREKEELKKTFDELSDQISWFRQISTSIEVSQPSTPTQLLQLSSECTDLISDFERTERQMKLPNSRETNSEIHERAHVTPMSRRHIQEENCKECQKRKKEENAIFQKNKEDIERLIEKLGPLKQEIMDFILSSLWDNSKRTQKWELHFSSQLDKLMELLVNAEKIQMSKPHSQTTAEAEMPTTSRDSDAVTSIIEDEETAGLTNALRPLIQPGNGPVSMKQLAKDMTEYLKMDSGAMNKIRGEIIKIVWKNDWKLDISMASAKIDTTLVAAIAAGIHFNTIQTREDSIPKRFSSTYSWIFQNGNPEKDGMPTWMRFPKWLDDDSKKVYWITGKPGSGKSTIMKLIVGQKYLTDRLSRSLESLRLLLVKYYAWLSGDTLQKSIEGLERTIIFQALEQYPDLAPVLTPRRWAFCQVLRGASGLPKWDTWEVEESFEALLSLCGETVKLALFIDGLDEFDTPPFEVIAFIRNMIDKCPNGLKVCAASRPWREFSDEFNEGPMLQMHLLTENDMKIFVNENFNINKGFVEQREINPKEASQLLTDIVQRANGVFIWVSIVVQLLTDRFSDGQSLFEARRALEEIPPDISSLYNTIWAGIHPNNLPDASYLMQVLRAFHGPLPWLTLWLIEESRFAARDEVVLPGGEKKIMAAQRSLKRKLAARTKCILEISEGGRYSFVDFIHRTARDWAVKPNMWQLICSKTVETFDPHLCILKGETLQFSFQRYFTKAEEDLDSMTDILRHASQVRDVPENESEFINYLTFADELLELTKEKGHEKNFVVSAAQFAILPYIKAVACSGSTAFSQPFSGGSLQLVEATIYGDPTCMDMFNSQAHLERRLAVLEYLLHHDAIHWGAHIWSDPIRDLKKKIQDYLTSHPVNSEYFSTVLVYLDAKENSLIPEPGIRSRIRSLFMRITQ